MISQVSSKPTKNKIHQKLIKRNQRKVSMLKNRLSFPDSGEKLSMFSMHAKISSLVDIINQQTKEIKSYKEEIGKLYY